MNHLSDRAPTPQDESHETYSSPDSANDSSLGFPTAIHSQPAQPRRARRHHSGQVVIEPGLSVGPLKLGDSRERALELFPKKDEDQEWENRCGTTLDWVDSSNPTGRGDVLIRLKKGKVFQIESATTRFQTAEGITTFDHADKVAEAYKDLRAYTLLSTPIRRTARVRSSSGSTKRRASPSSSPTIRKNTSAISSRSIVFEPNKTFCPEEESVTSSKWQSIPAYSLEPPPELAPNLN